MCPGTVWFGWVWVRVRVWESDKQKKWSKVYSFCFSFWVLSCSILVEKFLKKKVEKSKFWKGVFSIKTRENRYDERSPGTVLRREIHRFVKAWVFEILKSLVYITQNLSKIFWLNVSGNCLIWLSLEWGEGLSIWDIKISGIYNSKLVKNFLIKCVRELFDLVEFGLGLGFENLINKKSGQKYIHFVSPFEYYHVLF